MDPAKLKVVELRSQLGKRGLDTKGNKAVLVERLRKALEDETGDRKLSLFTHLYSIINVVLSFSINRYLLHTGFNGIFLLLFVVFL